jgi:superfamily I DNA/RNA helicase
VVDEAQDIGSMQVALLELLASAGSEITLIGDPNQAIFEFCGADGSYLRAYPARTGVVPKDLTINYRSVPRIVNAANSIAHRSDTAHRPEPAIDNGAFFLPFGNSEEGKLIAAFEAAIRAAGLSLSQSAVVCRATQRNRPFAISAKNINKALPSSWSRPPWRETLPRTTTKPSG